MHHGIVKFLPLSLESDLLLVGCRLLGILVTIGCCLISLLFCLSFRPLLELNTKSKILSFHYVTKK